MLKKYLLLLVGIMGIIGMLSLGGSYTPPIYNDINFSLCSGYEAPVYNDINFSLGEDDSCGTCNYGSGNWEVDCSDNCSITSNIDLGGNNISIVGIGTFVTTANITGVGNVYVEGNDSVNICRVTSRDGGSFK